MPNGISTKFSRLSLRGIRAGRLMPQSAELWDWQSNVSNASLVSGGLAWALDPEPPSRKYWREARSWFLYSARRTPWVLAECAASVHNAGQFLGLGALP